MKMFILRSFSLLIFICKYNYCLCNIDDFQANVDGFIDAFDEAYSTEVNTQSTDEITMGNEIVGNDHRYDISPLDEASVKEHEVTPVTEEVVTETVFHPGSVIRHEINQDLHQMAAKIITSINPDLKLVNITEAVSMVTNKVERSLSLRVAHHGCEGDCSIICRVDLVDDTVTWHNCDFNDLPRTKRGAVGGFKQVEEAEARELADIAAHTLDSIDADEVKRVVTQVIRAQKQLVNGIMYHLTLEMAQSDCKEEDDKCEGKLSDFNICKILMQRLFSGEAPHNAQVIKSECNPISKSKEMDGKKKAKRHVSLEGIESNMIVDNDQASTKKFYTHNRVMGGRISQDPGSDKIKEISEFALREIDKSSNSLNKQKIVRIVDAKSQVVAGVKYFLKLELVETNCRKGSAQEICNPQNDEASQSCEVVVWDKPMEKFLSVLKVDCSPVYSRKKRALVGGWKPADTNDEKVKEIAQFAVKQLDAKSNSLNAQKLVLIKEAKTQVVAGTNYFLKIQLVETNCRKGSEANSNCSAINDKFLQECDVEVYDRPWDKHRQMISANCSVPAESGRNRRALVGGLNPADTNDERVKEIAQFALTQLDAKSNSLNSQKLILIKEAKTQVVAGTNYFLKIQLVETNCRKGSEANSNCSAINDKPIQECDVVVYDRSWDKHRVMTSDKCSSTPDNLKRNKRGLLIGGKFPQDNNSENVRDMAQFAVEDLNKKSNSMVKQILVEVISAETQVVSGTNYHLKLKVVDSDCTKHSPETTQCSPKEDSVSQECEMTVWSRPWLKQRKVTKTDCKQSQDNHKSSGGLKSVDPLAPEVLEVARFSLPAIDRGSNSIYRHALIRVIDSKVQIVSGKKYFLTLEVGDSECSKNSDKENCTLRADNLVHDKCNVVVWDQPWLGKKDVISTQCSSRTKQSKNDLHISMFEEFKRKYNKVYPNEEEHKKRFRIFRANLLKIKALQDSEQGTGEYGPNMFADLSGKEFRQQYLGLKPGPVPKTSVHHMVPAQVPDVTLPVEFDWRDKGAVTPVKNQGQCGSCWAFSVTGNVEGQWFIKHGKLLLLSEQELVDCDKTDSGCEGGYMTQAYEAIEKLGGLETEDVYPYEGADDSCKFNQSEARATVTSSVNITTNETEIAQWLYKNGPISIGINANAMQFYMGGVSHPFKFLCNKNQLDHGVLLVGFGVHNYPMFHKSLPFWIVKNSWGPRWGEQGYYRVYRGDGTCGVNQMASSAVVG